jgi:flagellar capping protein FliD
MVTWATVGRGGKKSEIRQQGQVGECKLILGSFVFVRVITLFVQAGEIFEDEQRTKVDSSSNLDSWIHDMQEKVSAYQSLAHTMFNSLEFTHTHLNSPSNPLTHFNSPSGC